MCTYCITPLAKWLCDTPLVIITLKFHDLHPFLIYTPTPSVYAHPIFNCVVGSLTDVVLADAILIFTPPNNTAHQFKEGKGSSKKYGNK